MLPPYMSCPFVSQSMNMMYESPFPTMPVQQQIQQYPQQYLQQFQYDPMQIPQGAYEEAGQIDMSPEMIPRDPPPVLSNNPATVRIALFKELTAYPNYGNPSRNADILYTGNRGAWTFETPAFLFVPGNLRASIVIRAVLDDHFAVPVGNYSARITINGGVVHNGRVPLEHGRPAGGMFTNWVELPFNITNYRRVTRVVIENTSTAGANDWIAFDWMELRLTPR